MEQDAVVKEAVYVAYAIGAGLLGYINRKLDKGEVIVWKIAAAESLGAGLFGYWIMLACFELDISPGQTGIIIGFLSWLGIKFTSNTFKRVFLKKIRAFTETEGDKNERS
jgi:hypothetical protein